VQRCWFLTRVLAQAVQNKLDTMASSIFTKLRGVSEAPSEVIVKTGQWRTRVFCPSFTWSYMVLVWRKPELLEPVDQSLARHMIELERRLDDVTDSVKCMRETVPAYVANKTAERLQRAHAPEEEAAAAEEAAAVDATAIEKAWSEAAEAKRLEQLQEEFSQVAKALSEVQQTMPATIKKARATLNQMGKILTDPVSHTEKTIVNPTILGVKHSNVIHEEAREKAVKALSPKSLLRQRLIHHQALSR
jgi:hypothetical protein